MDDRGGLANGVNGLGDRDDRDGRKRPLLRRRSLLLGVTALVALVAWGARWILHFTNFTGLVVSDRVEVVRVLPDGPAAGSGIEAGDRVVGVDGRAVANLTDYLTAMQDPGLKGRLLSVRLRRHGEDVAAKLTVASYPVFHPMALGTACGVGLILFGLYVYLRKPRDPASGLYLLLSDCLFVLLALSPHLLRQTPSPSLCLLWGTALVAVVPLNLHFYLVFPERKRFLDSHPGIIPALYVLPAVFFFLLAGIIGAIEWNLARGLNCGPSINRLRYLFLAYFVVGLATCPAFVASLLHSYLRASSAERKRQVQVVLTGALATLLFAGLAVSGLLRYLASVQTAASFPAGSFDALYAVTVLATVVLPLSMAVAILKYRLWDLDSTLHGGTTCMVLSVVLMVLYSAIAGVFGWIFGRFAGPASDVPLIVFMLTLAAVFEPLRRLVERVLTRFFNPGAHLYRPKLLAVSDALIEIRQVDGLAAHVCEKVSSALAARPMAVVLDGEGAPGTFRVAASVGLDENGKRALVEAARSVRDLSKGGAARGRCFRLAEGMTASLDAARGAGLELAVAIHHHGGFLGCLFLGPKDGEAPYTNEDQALLQNLSNQLGTAIANARAFEKIEELQAAQAAHLAKVEEQKSEIERLSERLLGENRTLKERFKRDLDFGEIVGAAHGLKSAMETVASAAQSEATVLILGETGTGKELVARAIHLNSPRAQGPYVALNVSAVSAGLLQDEIFGHEKGAFTGATNTRLGVFELAEHGSAFLDEIGDIPPETQVALLRVLQEKEFQRVGGRQVLKADVRVIAATNRDLDRAVEEGRFRADLYYRLNVVPLWLPPLRERLEDIRELALHFLAKVARKEGKPITAIDEAVIEQFKLYPWPGNVRELQNVIERAVIVCRGEVLGLEDFPVLKPGAASARSREPVPAKGPREKPSRGGRPAGLGTGADPARGRSLKAELDEIERSRIVEAIEAAGGNRTEAARSFGVSRSTFYDKMKKHGLLTEEPE